MRENFLTDSLKVLLQQPWLITPERQLLEALLGAATLGTYWDELARMGTRNPDTPLIIRNIVTKAKSAGLTPAFEYLKDHYDHLAEV